MPAGPARQPGIAKSAPPLPVVQTITTPMQRGEAQHEAPVESQSDGQSEQLAAAYLGLIDRRWHRDCAENRHDEYEDILALLVADARPAGGATLLLAQAVARACLGDDHLWHDLGLPERQTLSALLRDCFPGLFARNSGNMRWKKFFYLQLCEQAEIRACRAPSCGVCVNFAECFDGEETPLAALRTLAEGAR